jgi:hypothetical protein
MLSLLAVERALAGYAEATDLGRTGGGPARGDAA